MCVLSMTKWIKTVGEVETCKRSKDFKIYMNITELIKV